MSSTFVNIVSHMMRRGFMGKFNAQNLMIARREKKLTQDDLAIQIDVARATIINWESGRFEPDAYNMGKLSKALDKPTSYFKDTDLMIKEPSAKYGSDVDLRSIKALTPDNVINLPLLASIPAGLPDYSDKDIESFTRIPRYLFPGADFIIHCCGDSMEPEIGKGAYCVIKKETQALNNRIMLVKTEDGFTIKRVIKKGNTIELHPTNGNYKVIKPKELKIIGEVIGTWKRISPK